MIYELTERFFGGIMEVFFNIIFLVFGMFLLIKGADYFVDGSSNIAKALKVPSLIIGLTLVSIGTSAPELSVSITSALTKQNDLSFGNIVGSNIFNVLVVIGASCFITPLLVSEDVLKIDIPILLFIYAVLILFGFVITPLKLDLWESLIIFSLFFIYTAFLIIRGIKQDKSAENEEENAESDNKKMNIVLPIMFFILGIVTLILHIFIIKGLREFVLGYAVYFIICLVMLLKPLLLKSEHKTNNLLYWLKSLIYIALGLIAIIQGGQIVVDSATFIAQKCGMDEVLVGLTIVAIGTSLPELATSIIAAKKHENDIAIGNAIGSCIFNVILILGLSSSINSLTLSWNGLVDVLVMTFAIVLTFILVVKSKRLYRKEGIIMIAFYIGYMTYIIARNYL